MNVNQPHRFNNKPRHFKCVTSLTFMVQVKLFTLHRLYSYSCSPLGHLFKNKTKKNLIRTLLPNEPERLPVNNSIWALWASYSNNPTEVRRRRRSTFQECESLYEEAALFLKDLHKVAWNLSLPFWKKRRSTLKCPQLVISVGEMTWMKVLHEKNKSQRW